MSEANPPGLDPTCLRAYLDQARPGMVTAPLHASLIQGGRSNLTYRVTDGVSSWVVRRPPLGHVLATAHDMTREHRVIHALGPTGVPVPRALMLCEDSEVLGAPFFVMDLVPGTPYRTAEELLQLGPERTRSLMLRLPDTLALLHAVDPAEVGLADFGRPEGFLERQLRRWGKQFEGSRSREVPGIEELRRALGERLPPSSDATIVHGDFRLDNVLVTEEDQVSAVLDWEMSTLGDPLTDLGLLVMYSSLPPLPNSPIGTTSQAPGHPSADDLVERYATESGRDVSEIDWYTAFAYFKLAVIAEGIHYRYTLGQTVGAGFDGIGAVVPVLTDRGLELLGRG